MIDSCKTMQEFCDLKHTQLHMHTDSILMRIQVLISVQDIILCVQVW